MLNICDSTEMCEVASSSGSQSMALAEVGFCACGSSHCFSLTLPQVHNALGLVSGLDGRSPILLYLILYHILVVLCVPWIINIEPPFTTTKLGGYMFQVQTLCLYPVCLLACKVPQPFDSTEQLQMLCAKKVRHDSCLSRRKT